MGENGLRIGLCSNCDNKNPFTKWPHRWVSLQLQICFTNMQVEIESEEEQEDAITPALLSLISVPPLLYDAATAHETAAHDVYGLKNLASPLKYFTVFCDYLDNGRRICKSWMTRIRNNIRRRVDSVSFIG